MVPFVIEGIAVQSNIDGCGSQSYQGLNNSPLFHDNAIVEQLQYGEFEVHEDDNVLTAIHIICPNVEYSSYSKASFDLSTFMPSIRKVLNSVLGDYYKSRDKAEKDRQKTYKKALKEVEEKKKMRKGKRKIKNGMFSSRL